MLPTDALDDVEGGWAIAMAPTLTADEMLTKGSADRVSSPSARVRAVIIRTKDGPAWTHTTSITTPDPSGAAHDQDAPQAHAGHDRHEGHSVAMFRDRFWLSLLLTIPVVVWSHEVQMWLGYEAPAFPGSDLIPPILGTIVFLYGGSVFLRGALPELRDRQPGMMTLIAMAITVAFVTSWAATLGLFEVEIWWELATLITIMLLGHWLEMRSIAQARGALAALADLLPDTAERVVGDGDRSRAPRGAGGGRPRARATGRTRARRRHGRRRHRRRRRIDDHRRVAGGRQGGR